MGVGPVEWVGAEGFEDFILRVGHGSKGMPVTLEPGEEYSVDIKIGVAHKTPEGDHKGVVRIVVTGVSTTYDIPALITVVDGKGNPKMNQTAPAHENTTEGALGDDTTTTLEGTPADGGVIGSTGQEGQAGEAATTTTVSSATESGPPPAQATQVRPPAQD